MPTLRLHVCALRPFLESHILPCLITHHIRALYLFLVERYGHADAMGGQVEVSCEVAEGGRR